MYTVTKLKTFMGRDCPGYNATLCRDGKPVADIIESGDGGGTEFHWKDHNRRVTTTIIGYDEKPRECNLTEEEAMLYKHVETLPPVDFDGMPLRVSIDMFVEDLVSDLEVEKAVKRVLKFPSIIEGKSILQWKKTPLDDSLRAFIRGRHPTAVILNDLPFADAVKAYKKAAG